MRELSTIHPTIGLDDTVDRVGESEVHWAIKAAIVNRFRTNPAYRGTVKTEKKTSDLTADVLCEFDEAPPDTPQKCVVEVQTSASDKDVLRTVEDHLRHGYAVYWVYDVDALEDREEAEETLETQINSIPSFGAAALEAGELSLGAPIIWDEFEFRTPGMGQNELYVPVHYRWEQWYNHGEFIVNGGRVMVYRVAGESEFFTSRTYDDGQQTLPRSASLEPQEFYRGIKTGEIRRASPVRGPP